MSPNRLLAFIVVWLLCAASGSPQAIISTVAGGGPDHMPATVANLAQITTSELQHNVHLVLIKPGSYVAAASDQGTWWQSSDMPGARSGFVCVCSLQEARTLHAATLLADGKVLVAGGVGGFRYLDSAELYDPTTRTFAPA